MTVTPNPLSRQSAARSTAAERARSATRARLLRSGRILFAEQGLHRITTHDIAAHAGVAAGTFYNHFGDKAALFREITDQALADLTGRLDAVALSTLEPEESVRLQATALVNEAWLRLAGRGQAHEFENQSHFYHAAAEAMRRVLIDHARSRGRVKRGGGRNRALVNVLDLAIESDVEEVTAVDDAIRQLEEKDPRAGRVVRLRFFAGLSVEETAAVLQVSPRTVMGDWSYARAWLFGALAESDEREESS